MAFDLDGHVIMEESGGEGVPPRRKVPHYHGDEVRVIFVVAAVVLIVAQSTGADLPFSTFGAVATAILLVVMAGITNPATKWIHWADMLIAVAGALVFGTSAVSHYRAGVSAFDPSFVYIETLSLLALFALYFSTRTVRASCQCPE